jgi:small-conductance mechanosensitive channel
MDSILRLSWVVPVSFVLGGYIAGKIFEHVVLGKLKKLAEMSSWKGDDIAIDALGRTILLWCSLLGFYGALVTTPVPANVYTSLNKVLLVVFIASGTALVARMAVNYVNLYSASVSGVLPSTTIFSNLMRLIVYLTGLLVILQSLGISITPILTALGVGGLAVALALQDTLSNLFSGLQIIGSGQVKPGDFIRLESGEEGYVVDVTWRNTTVRQLPNNMIIVPNSQLASSRVTNFYQPDKELAVLVQVGVSYESDLRHVERVTMEVARQVMREATGGVPDFEPFIRYHTFADFSINFTVIMRGKEFVDQYFIKHEFVKRLHDRYNVEGIEIPFPIRTVHVKQELPGGAVLTAKAAAHRNSVKTQSR